MTSPDLPATMPPGPHFIDVTRVTYLRGPNMWTYTPVIEAWLDLGVLEDWPSHRQPGFIDRLLSVLPQVAAHHCSPGVPYGFEQRLREGTWMGHILEHVIIELMELAGLEAGFGQTRETTKPGTYRMVFRVPDETVGRTALAAGLALLHAVINHETFDIEPELAKIRKAIDEYYLGPSTAHIVASAKRRKIPHIRLNQGNLVQLGYGALQNRIWTAETDLTSAIAEGIAGNKDLTKSLLRSCGVPVPYGEVVHSAEAAWEAAQDIGVPVVVKPRDGNRGRGVMLNLRTQEEVLAAYAVARAEDPDVIVEQFIEGDEHRVLVVGGKVVAVARGESAWVNGDGTSTIEQLVELQINSDPRRGNTDIHPLETLQTRTNSVILANLQRQRLTPDSVPAAGQPVLITANGNHAIECTARIHPEGLPVHAGGTRGRTRYRRRRPGVPRHLAAAGVAVRRGGRGQCRPQPADAPEAGRGPAAAGGRRHCQPPVPRRPARPYPHRGRGRQRRYDGDRAADGLADAVVGRARGRGLSRRPVRRRAPARGARLRALGAGPAPADQPQRRSGGVRERSDVAADRRPRLRPLLGRHRHRQPAGAGAGRAADDRARTPLQDPAHPGRRGGRDRCGGAERDRRDRAGHGRTLRRRRAAVCAGWCAYSAARASRSRPPGAVHRGRLSGTRRGCRHRRPPRPAARAVAGRRRPASRRAAGFRGGRLGARPRCANDTHRPGDLWHGRTSNPRDRLPAHRIRQRTWN